MTFRRPYLSQIASSTTARGFAALAIAVIVLGSGSALGAVTPRAVALDATGVLRGVLHDHGVALLAEDLAYWNCNASLGIPVTQMVAVGSVRLMAWGPTGVISSDDIGGCNWRAMGGNAGIAQISGVYQRDPGGLTAVIALGGTTPLAKISITQDGGATSAVTNSLSLAEYDVLGLAGNQDALAVVAQHGPSGTVGVWRSPDLAQSWGDREADLVPVSLVPVALATDGAIVGLAGSDVGVWQQGAWTVLRSFSEPPHSYGSDSRGRAAFATVDGVFVADGSGSITKVGEPGWSTVALASGVAVVGRPGVDGEPWVATLTLQSQGAPKFIANAAATPQYPANCQASLAIRCDSERDAMLLAFEVPPTTSEGPVDSGPPTTEGCATTHGSSMGLWLLLLCCLLRVGSMTTRRSGRRRLTP